MDQCGVGFERYVNEHVRGDVALFGGGYLERTVRPYQEPAKSPETPYGIIGYINCPDDSSNFTS